MTVALSRPNLNKWIGNAIEDFRLNDLLSVPEQWLDIYQALSEYLSTNMPVDQQLLWMIEGTGDDLPDIIYRLQRIKNALVGPLMKIGAEDELTQVLAWFDRATVLIVEKVSGKFSEEHSLSVPYETIFWKARDGMYISTIEGRFLECNEALLKMLKFPTVEEISKVDIGKELYLAKGERQIMIDHLIRDGFYDHHEFRCRCSDGEIKTAMESCYLVKVPGGKQYIVGVMVDITREKEVEKKTTEYLQSVEKRGMEANLALRRVSQRQDDLLALITYPVLMVDPVDFKILNANRAFFKRFAYRKVDLKELGFRDLFPGDDWMAVFRQITFSAGRGQFHIRGVSCRTAKDKTFEVDIAVKVNQDDLGNHLLVAVQDRSELMNIKNSLQKARHNLEQTLSGAPIGIIGFKSDGSVGLMNRYLRRLIGHDRADISLSFLNRLFEKEEQRLKFHKYIRQFLQGDHAENVIIDLRIKTGEIKQFQLDTIAYRFDDEDSPGFLALLVDISRQIELEGLLKTHSPEPGRLAKEYKAQQGKLDHLQLQHQALQKQSDLRLALLETVAKKFKTPLHVVLGFTSLLKHDLAALMNESQSEDLGIINDHVSFVVGMLEKTSELVQLERGAIPFQPEMVSVRTMLDDLFEVLEPDPLPEQISFKAEHGILSLDSCISVDQHLLEVMLRHLIDNAVTFTEEGLVQLEAYEDKGRLFLEIRDTGRGIDPSDLEHVFDPFFHVASTSQALGLGLTNAKKYADLMDVDLELQSIAGEGTTLVINLGPVQND